jgi:hypothetical protein
MFKWVGCSFLLYITVNINFKVLIYKGITVVTFLISCCYNVTYIPKLLFLASWRL